MSAASQTMLSPREGHLVSPCVVSRVIVIGAGPAGLAASRRLQENDVKVTIVEARQRAGGRAHSFAWEGASGANIDLGASFVHGSNDNNPVSSWFHDTSPFEVYLMARRIELRISKKLRLGTRFPGRPASDQSVLFEDTGTLPSLAIAKGHYLILPRHPRLFPPTCRFGSWRKRPARC